MSDEFYLSRKNYHVLELPVDSASDPKAEDETLTEQSGRLLGKALGGSYVIVDNQPLEAIGSVPMTEEQLVEFNADLLPLIEQSILRLRERLREAGVEDLDAPGDEGSAAT